MIRVATREAENPVGKENEHKIYLEKKLFGEFQLTSIARKLNFNRYHAPKLSLPGKIVFPR